MEQGRKEEEEKEGEEGGKKGRGRADGREGGEKEEKKGKGREDTGIFIIEDREGKKDDVLGEGFYIDGFIIEGEGDSILREEVIEYISELVVIGRRGTASRRGRGGGGWFIQQNGFISGRS